MTQIETLETLSISMGTDTVEIPLSTKCLLGTPSRGRGVRVQVPRGASSSYVHLREDPSLTEPPHGRYLEVNPGGWYKLEVEFWCDDPDAALWVFEFGADDRTRYFRSPRKPGGFNHVWPVREDSDRLALALSFKRDCDFEIRSIRLEHIPGTTFETSLWLDPGSAQPAGSDPAITGVILDRYIAAPENQDLWRSVIDRHTSQHAARNHYLLARLCYCYEVVAKGGSLLEAGVGHGEFLKLVSSSGQFERVQGIDKMFYNPKGFRETLGFNVDIMDLTEVTYDDRSWDAVICMQVLEHMSREAFDASLHHLRRIYRDQLVVSVPFNEPEPLPPYHLLRFSDEDILAMFPKARKHLLYRRHGYYPCILLEETHA